MRILSRFLSLFVVLVGATNAMADAPVVVPPDASVAGVSQADWSQRWWEWAGSFDREESPVADRTGALCGSGQSGDVWFLAGTYGTQRTVRTCRVPRGKYLFFPLINYVVVRRPDRATSCEAVASSAASITEGVSALVLEIDGVRHGDLHRHRLATRGCFDIGARTPERIRVYPAAANGYYVMLQPLPPGRHTLNFGGALPSMLQAVTYSLVVE
ncbi:MAG TPA: hypothetical protein VFE82_07940 [Ramlibacter sp.]|jgi:hypothetical protein|uniref:hypothetical protein n=1 Tax=Ramlibacter sp. TaxID=1917967 RepID=UPI002D4E9EAD|nr:hypothetical protein [Ramlibacter sp.]HZY18397.1 hypothetical protein [Ramlibacter sp.]